MPVPFLGRAIRRRHSANDEERGGHVIARHMFIVIINVQTYYYLSPWALESSVRERLEK